MNKTIKITASLLVGVASLVSCKKDFEYVFADKGPDVTVESFSESAYMGGEIAFSVALQDKDFDLSTVKAQLYFDDVMVADTTIRTKTPGSYEGKLDVPFLKNIPDGIASLVFVGQNVGQGITEVTKEVAVSRPDFEYLTLVAEDGQTYRMEKTAANAYSVDGSFPAKFNAMIETPAVSGTENKITFGWDGSGAAVDGESYIPFSNSVSGYTISFNTLTFEASPFITIYVNGTKAEMVDGSTYAAVVKLTKGGELKITGYEGGFSDWSIDPDFIETSDPSGVYKFLPVDGLYKVNIDFANKFFKFEAMKSQTEYATLNTSDFTGAVWLIGDTKVGKPTMAQGASWSPEKGGLCLSQIEDRKYQITLVAGLQLAADKIDFKFFHQKTWGSEFGGGTVTTDSKLIKIGEKDGNIHLADGVALEMGGIYKFVLDLTNASYDGKVVKGAVLEVTKEGEQELPKEEITVNGQVLEMVSAGEYSGVLDLEQNATMQIAGVSDIASYYLDPDYVSVSASGATFAATSGKYRLNLYSEGKYCSFTKLNFDGKDATLKENALWMMAWGLAHPVMTQQFGFTEGAAFCMAEVRPLVYQLTGIAVDEKDGNTVGGRFRYDYISAKYFAQNGWGKETGKIFGSENEVKLAGSEAAKLKLTDSNNLELAERLEKGATYRLTVDLTKAESEGIETISLDKLQQ